MDILLALQLMSCMMAFVLMMQLLLCPYKGKEFRTYNLSRWLHSIAMLLLVLQYTVQMVFKIRAQNEVNGLTCNFFFYLPSNLLILLSVMILQRFGHLKKSDYFSGTIIVIISYIILTAGIFIKGGQHLSEANNICSYAFLLMQLIYIVKVARGYRRMTHHMDEFYGAPVEDYIKWMKTAIILMFTTFVMIPFTIFSVKVLQIFGFVYWVSQAYYVTKFLYYGRYAGIMEQSANPEAEDEVDTKKETDSTTNESDPDLEIQLKHWVEMKGYCDQETTIVKLATEIGSNRTTLSRHINASTGKTFREWINSLRIEEAKRLIKEQKEMTVEQISQQCGFSSRRYFDQLFNTYENMTATEWRKSNPD